MRDLKNEELAAVAGAGGCCGGLISIGDVASNNNILSGNKISALNGNLSGNKTSVNVANDVTAKVSACVEDLVGCLL